MAGFIGILLYIGFSFLWFVPIIRKNKLIVTELAMVGMIVYEIKTIKLIKNCGAN